MLPQAHDLRPGGFHLLFYHHHQLLRVLATDSRAWQASNHAQILGYLDFSSPMRRLSSIILWNIGTADMSASEKSAPVMNGLVAAQAPLVLGVVRGARGSMRMMLPADQSLQLRERRVHLVIRAAVDAGLGSRHHALVDDLFRCSDSLWV